METTATPQTFTAEDLLKMPDDGFRYELVRGELIKMVPPGAEHGGIASKLDRSLGNHVETHNLGKTYVETGFELAPDTVRAPDVAFVRKERVEAAGHVTGYWPGAPDLAVEIISPNDLYTQVDEKVQEWLSFGARMVIVINPRNHAVTVYYSRTHIILLTEEDALDGGEVIPGWTIPVRNLFV
ncbi:MAG: Uma2 family endonuclease [Nitrospira sp.]|nr:Uma2 family endonuclease [Nitrospira sp.]